MVGPCGGVTQEFCWETEAGEALPGDAPTEPLGNCRLGQRSCDEDGEWTACIGAVGPESADACDVAGDDASCNGIANENCPCPEIDTMRECGDDTGNCQKGTQTCGATGWSACEGEVTPESQDSCAVEGDDANCNGTENDGCLCIEDVPGTCDDGIACTADTCQNGMCTRPIESSSCLINGNCYSHNQTDPNNPCRYCDANLNQNGWTNEPSTKSCDDDRWCNGTDTCSGGSCTHQFASGNRCTATGPCARPSCDEEGDTCFYSSNTVCSETTETECSSDDACGAVARSRNVVRYCSGSSASCDGTLDPGAWDEQTCDVDQVCSGSTHTCQDSFSCAAFCDSSTSLCWTRFNSQPMSWSEANTYCLNGTWGGEPDWELPNIVEWFGALRGCVNGTDTNTFAASICAVEPPGCAETSCSYAYNCGACSVGTGPGSSGCYWAAEFEGSCSNGFWSSTGGAASRRYAVNPNDGSVYLPPTADDYLVRCVTSE